jgi:D-alanyl-D-alanine carboxypeptidase (penicillin-binding protein 5/6)
MVVAGLGSFNQRIDESVKFMDWGFRSWKAQELFKAGEKVGTAQVQLGSDDEVGLVAPRNLAVTLPAGSNTANMRVKVVYSGPLKAPIKKGQQVASLEIQTPDTPPQTVPLVAEKDVGEAGFFGRLWAGVASFFG